MQKKFNSSRAQNIIQTQKMPNYVEILLGGFSGGICFMETYSRLSNEIFLVTDLHIVV